MSKEEIQREAEVLNLYEASDWQPFIEEGWCDNCLDRLALETMVTHGLARRFKVEESKYHMDRMYQAYDINYNFISSEMETETFKTTFDNEPEFLLCNDSKGYTQVWRRSVLNREQGCEVFELVRTYKQGTFYDIHFEDGIIYMPTDKASYMWIPELEDMYDMILRYIHCIDKVEIKTIASC